MSIGDAFNIALAVLVSIGGGGLIVTSLSSWLGKLWAERLMANQKKKHELELAKLSSDLRTSAERVIAAFKLEMDLTKETYLKSHMDKVAVYRDAVDLIAELLSDFDHIALTKESQATDLPERARKFNKGRMRIYGHMAMLAPQSVMDKLDDLIDYLFRVMHDGVEYKWDDARSKVLAVLNEARKDVGFADGVVVYKGVL